MAKIPPIAYIGAAGAAAFAGWFLLLRNPENPNLQSNGQTSTTQSSPLRPLSSPAEELVSNWNISPTTVSGSTSLAGLAEYFQEFGVRYEAKSSGKGIQELINGKVTLAAASRPLTPDEQFAGLVAHEIGRDALSFVVANGSDAPSDISRQELQSILAGNITNWNQVGGQNSNIDLVVRGDGGTKTSVLTLFGLTNFAPNSTFLSVDSTTQMLQTLDIDSIGFATASQTCNQQTVTNLTVDGLDVSESSYYPQRSVYLITKGQPGPNEQKVIDLARQIYSQELSATAICR